MRLPGRAVESHEQLALWRVAWSRGGCQERGRLDAQGLGALCPGFSGSRGAFEGLKQQSRDQTLQWLLEADRRLGPGVRESD